VLIFVLAFLLVLDERAVALSFALTSAALKNAVPLNGTGITPCLQRSDEI